MFPTRFPFKVRLIITLMGLAFLGFLNSCKPNKDNVVIIKYKPLVNFETYAPANQGFPPQVYVSTPGGIWTMYEVTQIQNTGKDAVPFTFKVGNLHSTSNSYLLDQDQLDTEPNITALLIPKSFTDVVDKGETRNYPLSTPVLTGTWCQTRQNIRIVIQFEELVSGDETVVSPLFYVNDAPTDHKIIIVNENQSMPAKYYPTLFPAQFINEVIDISQFFGDCGGGGNSGGNPGGGGDGGNSGGAPGGGGPGNGNGNGGSGNTGGRLPRQPYTFCVTAPGSGAQPQQITVVASSPAEALDKLKKENLPDGGAGYNITDGPCPGRRR
jgi:hypothetical protein